MANREIERLKAVNRYLHLETSKKQELEDIVSLAAEICGTPSASINFIDDETQFIRFKKGINISSTLREDAFCNHVIDDYKVLMIPDTTKDERFESNFLVKGDKGIRFYAGAPLTTHDGHNLGALCVVDENPKVLNKMQLNMLQILSRQVIQLLEFDASLSLLKEQFLLADHAETKIRSYFDSSAAVYLLLDKEFKILAFNKAVQNVMQRVYQVTLTRGMSVLQFIDEQYMPDFVESCKKAINGETVTHEQPLAFDKNFVYCDITYNPARNLEGEIIGISYNSIDITDSYKNKQAFLKSQTLLDKIAYIQSHELRKPVANIKGLLQLLELDGHLESIPELSKMGQAVDKLDEAIALIVNYTAKSAAKVNY